MKSTKLLAIAIFALGFTHLAQAQDSSAQIGLWKVVDVYAVDSTGSIDTSETSAVYADMVSDHTVEYNIGDSSFKLLKDGQSVGSCVYSIGPATDGGGGIEIQFDASGDDISDTVNKLIFRSLNGRNIYAESCSPDIGTSVIYHQVLLKQ